MITQVVPLKPGLRAPVVFGFRFESQPRPAQFLDQLQIGRLTKEIVNALADHLAHVGNSLQLLDRALP